MVLMFTGSRMAEAIKNWVQAFAPVLVLLVYTIAGAFLFQLLEGPNELVVLEELQKERAELLEATAFKLNNIRSMNALQAYNHTVRVLDKYREQLGVETVNVTNDRWNIWGAVFYTLCVYTTIGYGDIVPLTSTGRVFTILYAFIGIPLALISLICLGKLFAMFLTFLWTLGSRAKRVVVKEDQEVPSKKYIIERNAYEVAEAEALLQFPVLVLLLATILYIFACAAIFLLWEHEWSYGTSLYFTLISFLTIGFGDVLPSKRRYMIAVGILLLIGLALVSTLLNLIQQQIEALTLGMRSQIDEDCRETQAMDADEEPSKRANGATGSPDAEKLMPAGQTQDRTVENVVSRMPMKNRLLFRMMPASSKKQLKQYAQQRSQLVSRGCQTEDFLIQAMLDRYGSSDDVTQLVLEDVPSLPSQRGQARTIAQLDYIALSPD